MVQRYWPLDVGRVVTSPFGPRWGGVHTGVDFGFPDGSGGRGVYAVQAGTVIFAGAAIGYGGPDPAGWVVIDSDDSQGSGVFEYGHIVREVQIGAKVSAGQQIGYINPDRRTNGDVAPHLHLAYMPRQYDPARKEDPLPRLVGALDPDQSGCRTFTGAADRLFGVDISNNNGLVDIDRVKAEGFSFVWAKVSEGDTFKDSFWERNREECRRAGLVLAGYHYVRDSDPQAQADNFVTQLGDLEIPAMLDFETGSGDIENFWAVKHAIEAHGVAVRLSYIPRWYWQRIGTPDLSAVPGLIQSSYVSGTGYASVLYPGDNSPLWAAFGGKCVDVLQFTDRALIAGKQLNADAFRGDVDQLAALLDLGGPAHSARPTEPAGQDIAAGEP